MQTVACASAGSGTEMPLFGMVHRIPCSFTELRIAILDVVALIQLDAHQSELSRT